MILWQEDTGLWNHGCFGIGQVPALVILFLPSYGKTRKRHARRTEGGTEGGREREGNLTTSSVRPSIDPRRLETRPVFVYLSRRRRAA